MGCDGMRWDVSCLHMPSASQSHDQSLSQSIPFATHTLRLIGGTTKCARTAIRYFATLTHTQEQKQHTATETRTDTAADTSIFHNAAVVELGAGTGLVSQAMRLLGNMRWDGMRCDAMRHMYPITSHVVHVFVSLHVQVRV